MKKDAWTKLVTYRPSGLSTPLQHKWRCSNPVLGSALKLNVQVFIFKGEVNTHTWCSCAWSSVNICYRNGANLLTVVKLYQRKPLDISLVLTFCIRPKIQLISTKHGACIKTGEWAWMTQNVQIKDLDTNALSNHPSHGFRGVLRSDSTVRPRPTLRIWQVNATTFTSSSSQAQSSLSCRNYYVIFNHTRRLI